MSEAFFGLAGVIIGAVLTWIKEWWAEEKLRKRHARYLAIRVICILDAFLETCTDVVADDGLCDGQRNAEGYLVPQVPLPNSPSFPEDIDWKSIDHGLMYKILDIPHKVLSENRAICFFDNVSFPPDFDEYFEERQYRYACLGLYVAKLARELRREYRVPDRKFDSMDPMKFLQDRRDAIDQRRKRRESQPSILG